MDTVEWRGIAPPAENLRRATRYAGARTLRTVRLIRPFFSKQTAGLRDDLVIIVKLSPPLVRESLSMQTDWWRQALPILGETCRCIYTGTRLSPQDFSLDHYLPWSFVAHNRDWNLVPVSRTINSSKSDRIPDNCHIAALANLQHAGLRGHGKAPANYQVAKVSRNIHN